MAKTFVVILEAGNEVRLPDVEEAVEEGGDSIVAYGENKVVKARFRMRDVRTWYLE